MSAELTYTQHGDYLLPDIRLSEPPRNLSPERQEIGRYGRMRKAFLKEHRSITYNTLLLKETLFPHLRETEEAANTRLEQVMSILTSKNRLPDKAANPLGWTAEMNALKAQAEEMVLNELIYV
jgi:hypothetical protein